MSVQIVEHVNVVAPMDPYLSLRALASYSGLSVRTLRSYINRLDCAIPTYRLGGKVLVRKSEYDAWVQQYRVVGKPSLLAALAGAGLAAKYRLVDRPTPPRHSSRNLPAG